MAPEFKPASRIKVGAIIHRVDRSQYLKSSFNHIPIVEHYKGLDHFLKSVSSYTHLISTTLHGIIFSHSLGIPVLPAAISIKITGGSFKLNDYQCSIRLNQNEALMMLHQAPRTLNKLIEIISNYPQPNQELIEELSQKQERTIKKLLRIPPKSPSTKAIKKLIRFAHCLQTQRNSDQIRQHSARTDIHQFDNRTHWLSA